LIQSNKLIIPARNASHNDAGGGRLINVKNFNMSYDEDDDLSMEDDLENEDEPFDLPEDMEPVDAEDDYDPDSRYH
jgi:hypothetical protein